MGAMDWTEIPLPVQRSGALSRAKSNRCHRGTEVRAAHPTHWSADVLFGVNATKLIAHCEMDDLFEGGYYSKPRMR